MGTDKLINVFFRPIWSKIRNAIGPTTTPPSGKRDPIHGTAFWGTSLKSQLEVSLHCSGSTLGSTGDDHAKPHPHENEPNVAVKQRQL